MASACDLTFREDYDMFTRKELQEIRDRAIAAGVDCRWRDAYKSLEKAADCLDAMKARKDPE